MRTAESDETQMRIHLPNFFAEWEAAAGDPAGHAQVLARIATLAGITDTKDTFDEIRLSLRPRIRSRRYFEIDAYAMARAVTGGKSEAQKTPYRPLAEYLGVGLAVDRPQHIEYVVDPGKYGQPIDDLYAIALTNLKRLASRPLEEVAPGVYLAAYGDDYAVERVFLLDALGDAELQGDPVAFPVRADLVIVTGADDARGLEHALKLVQEASAEPRFSLELGFVRRDGTWEVFDRGEELALLLTMHRQRAYTAQRALLQAELGEREDVPFIAGLMGTESASVALWSEGAFSWLPEAELVAFEVNGKTRMLPWAKVRAACGDLMTPVPNVWPPRWEVRARPAADVLARLVGESAPEAPRTAPNADKPMLVPVLIGIGIVVVLAALKSLLGG